MQEIAAIVRHPLFLLVATALVSGLVVPRIAQRWQDHRKALEIKAGLVERLAGAVVSMFTAVQFAQVGARSQSQEDLDEAYRTWQTDKAVLTALVSAYFRPGAVVDAWTRCRAITTAYYVQIGIADRQRRLEYLRAVATGVARTPAEDWSEEVVDPATVSATAEELGDPGSIRASVRRHLDLTIQHVNDERMVLGARRSR